VIKVYSERHQNLNFMVSDENLVSQVQHLNFHCGTLQSTDYFRCLVVK